MAQDTIGRYQVLDQLRLQPLGRVAVCRDPDTQRQLLGKELFIPRHLTAGAQQELAFNFRLALRAVEESSSPHFVPLLEWGQAGDGNGAGTACCAFFELPQGECLKEALARGRTFAPGEALRVVDDCAAALQVLQENQVGPSAVDVGNVYLSAEGKAQWAELGFAHYLRDTADPVLRRAEEDFRFQSPEELKRASTTDASLVFSLGALLYRLIAGVPAYEGDSAVAVLLAMAKGPWEPLWNRVAEVPPGTEELLARALAREPAARPRDVGELRRALALLAPSAALTQSDQSADPGPPPEAGGVRPLGRWRTLAVAGAALALAAAGLHFLRPPRRPPVGSPATIAGSRPAQTPTQATPAPQQPTPGTPPAAQPPASVGEADARPALPAIRYQEPPRDQTTTLPVASPRSLAPSPPPPRRRTAAAPRRQVHRRGTRPVVRPPSLAPASPKVEGGQPAESLPEATPPPEAQPQPDAGTPPTGLPPGVKRRF